MVDGRGLGSRGSTRFYVLILSLASSFLFFSYIARFGYGVLLPRMIEDLGLSRAEAGFAYSVYIMLYSAFSVASGRLFDRFGIRIVSALCVVYGLGMVLVGLSSNYPSLLLSLAFAGLGAASAWTPMVALASSYLPSSWRGRSAGVLEVGIRASHGAVGLLLPPVALALGWRAAWLVFALPLFAYALAFHWLARVGGGSSLRLEGRRLVNYRDVLSSRRFWLIGLSYSFMGFGTYIVLTFLVDFLEREVKMPYVEASSMISLMGFTGIAGALLLSWVSDRVGRATILAASNGVASVSLALFSLLPQSTPLVRLLPLIMLMYGLFFGGLWPTYAACAGDICPSSVGTVLGLWTLMLGLSSLTSPVIGGLIADVTKSYVAALQLGMATYLMALVLAVAGLAKMKPSKKGTSW